MKNILKDISGKIDNVIVEVLLEIKELSATLNIPFFVIGATARDYLMEHCCGIRPPRITRDLDIGIQVSDWESYDNLSEALLKGSKFKKGKEKQRYEYHNILVDIIPFGSICDAEKNIKWPPDQEIIMNMLGFDEVYENSIVLRLNKKPALDIRVPTIPGLAILKVISWNDQYPLRERDAEDLFFMMNKYESAGIEDRLYNEESDLLEEEKFDNRLAGIKLLGKDMAKICSIDTSRKLREILIRETDVSGSLRLIRQIIGKNSNFDEALSFLEKLKQGFFK